MPSIIPYKFCFLYIAYIQEISFQSISAYVFEGRSPHFSPDLRLVFGSPQRLTTIDLTSVEPVGCSGSI